jgi:hypothetical protein
MNLATRVSSNLKNFGFKSDVSRVIDCWRSFSDGKRVRKYLDPEELVLQEADCYVDGLRAMSFHDLSAPHYDWVHGLEKNYETIKKELFSYQKKQVAEWLPPRDASGEAYGPEWKTLGLQDRGVWEDHSRLKYFRKTQKLLIDNDVPCQEVFFARQGAGSGIAPHTDKNNFIITCHIALDVPEGECWLKVGKDKYFWKNGEGVVFDTSIEHSTANEADTPRHVLLVRFWHPELTLDERRAFQYIFDMLDHAGSEESLSNFEARAAMFAGKDYTPVSNILNDRAEEATMLKSKSKKRRKETTAMKGFGTKL